MSLTFDCWRRHFLRARRSCMLPLRWLRFQLWFKISYPCFIYGNNSVQKLLTCLVAPQQFFCDPLASCFLFFAQLMRNPICSDVSILQCLSPYSVNRSGWHVCFMCNFFTWFASIFFQQGAYDNLCFFGRHGYSPDRHESRFPPWHRATIHYTTPANFMWSIVNFGWVFSLQIFNFLIAGHCARSDSSSVLQNRDHVVCQYAHSVLYWSLAHDGRENQNDCIILLAAQAQCAELLKLPT